MLSTMQLEGPSRGLLRAIWKLREGSLTALILTRNRAAPPRFYNNGKYLTKYLDIHTFAALLFRSYFSASIPVRPPIRGLSTLSSKCDNIYWKLSGKTSLHCLPLLTFAHFWLYLTRACYYIGLTTGPYWALLGLTGPYWALLGLTGPHCTGPHWALLGLTGPYWALLSLTGPYWASLGLMEQSASGSTFGLVCQNPLNRYRKFRT